MCDWPEAYQDMNSKEVQEFKKSHADRIEFYKYTQFETDKQLGHIKETCERTGMSVGVYTDIAVGSSPIGFEAWARRDDYIKANAGAPPDDLCITGQNWGLMGFKPHKLAEKSYSQFIGMLRANMKHAGCARLDHVLQLSRLYMIPEGKSEREGTFVHYPEDDLMSLVALESHRNKTMFIGDDIGQCPDGFREKLSDYGIHRYSVLWLERENGYRDGDLSLEANKIKDPSEFPKFAACALSTHDTPPAEGQNTGEYVYQKKAWGSYDDDEQMQEEINQYKTHRLALNEALKKSGCWDKVGGKPSENPFDEPFSLSENKHIQAQVAYMAMMDSNIVLIPPSDVTGIKAQHNVPGTAQTQAFVSPSDMKDGYEYKKNYEWHKAGPNWRRKEAFKLHEFGEISLFNECAEILNASGRGNPREPEQYEYQRPGRNEAIADKGRRNQLMKFFAKSKFHEKKGELQLRAKYSKKYQDKLKDLNEGMRKQTEAKRAEIEDWKAKQQAKKAEQPILATSEVSKAIASNKLGR